MNTRTTVLPVLDADAPIECLDAIAQTVKAFIGVGAGDRDLEGQNAILVENADRRPGPA